MADQTLPGSWAIGEGYGTIYPVNDHGTGFNNVEEANYGSGGASNRIFITAHPLSSNHPPVFKFEVHSGDPQPHYPGSSGERTEIWSEPHDGQNGVSETVCASFIVPAGQSYPTGWSSLMQDHIGEDDVSVPSEGGAGTAFEMTNGVFAVYRRFYGHFPWNAVQGGREVFVQCEQFHSLGGDGHVKWLVAWDSPPSVSATPFMEWNSQTQFGTNMYWKTGLYRSASGFTNTVYVTSWGKRSTVAAARAAAGWGGSTGGGGGGTTPPPTTTPMTSFSFPINPLAATSKFPVGDSIVGGNYDLLKEFSSQDYEGKLGSPGSHPRTTIVSDPVGTGTAVLKMSIVSGDTADQFGEQRNVIWKDPHDVHDGDGVWRAWKILIGNGTIGEAWVNPTGWGAEIQQIHIGNLRAADTDPQQSALTGLHITPAGALTFEFANNPVTVLQNAVTKGQWLYFVQYTQHSYVSGQVRLWMGIGAAPDITQTPLVSKIGVTMVGVDAFDEIGLYESDGSPSTSYYVWGYGRSLVSGADAMSRARFNADQAPGGGGGSGGLGVANDPNDLARGKTVVASSFEDTGLEGNKAVDSDPNTRWSSAFADGATLMVDLGAAYNIATTVLDFENAYSPHFAIDYSQDGVTGWVQLGPTLFIANPGVKTFTLAGGATARYWRFRAIDRATGNNDPFGPYGVSLWTFSLFAAGAGPGAGGGGSTPPVGGDVPAYTGYTLTFNDPFDGASLDARWQQSFAYNGAVSAHTEGDPGVGPTGESWVTDGTGVTVSNGEAVMEVKVGSGTDVWTGKVFPYHAGMFQSGGTYDGAQYPTIVQTKPVFFAQKYGRFEAEILCTNEVGLYTAFWLLPITYKEDLNNDGEIDIMEVLGRQPTLGYFSLHRGYRPGRHATSGGINLNKGDLSSAYHLYSLEWDANLMRWLVDNVEVFRVTDATLIPTLAMYMNLQIGSGTAGDGWAEAPTAARLPKTARVRAVRVYQRTGTTGANPIFPTLATVKHTFQIANQNPTSDGSTIEHASGATVAPTKVVSNNVLETDSTKYSTAYDKTGYFQGVMEAMIELTNIADIGSGGDVGLRLTLAYHDDVDGTYPVRDDHRWGIQVSYGDGDYIDGYVVQLMKNGVNTTVGEIRGSRPVDTNVVGIRKEGRNILLFLAQNFQSAFVYVGTITINDTALDAGGRLAAGFASFQIVPSANVGEVVLVKNFGYGGTLTAKPVITTPSVAPTNTTAPTLTGSAILGQLLTMNPGVYSGDTPMQISYQWKRETGVGTGVYGVVANQIQATYLLGRADVDLRIKGRSIATNGAGTAGTDTAATAVVTGVYNDRVPAIIGPAVVGTTLQGDDGDWLDEGVITKTYKWYRGRPDLGVAFVAISGATSVNYTIVSADIGFQLDFEVTGDDGH